MFTLLFWKAVAERGIRAGAAALVSTWIVGDKALNALHLDYEVGLGIFLGGVLFSMLSSIAASAITEEGTPSFNRSEGLKEPEAPDVLDG